MSKEFIPIQENFILLMEKNSAFSRENLFLLCLDPQSVSVFENLGIPCARVTGVNGHQPIYRMRVKVCTVRLSSVVLCRDWSGIQAKLP